MMQLLLKRKAKPKLPHFTQKKDYTCGPACMKIALHTLGIWVSEKHLEEKLGTTREEGTPNLAFPAAAEEHKLNYCVGRNGTIRDLRRLQRENYRIIVGYFAPWPEDPSLEEGHYAVVKHIGWRYIKLFDPEEGVDRTYTTHYFKSRWHNDPRYEAEEGWYFAVKK